MLKITDFFSKQSKGPVSHVQKKSEVNIFVKSLKRKLDGSDIFPCDKKLSNQEDAIKVILHYDFCI